MGTNGIDEIIPVAPFLFFVLLFSFSFPVCLTHYSRYRSSDVWRPYTVFRSLRQLVNPFPFFNEKSYRIVVYATLVQGGGQY